MIDAIFSLPLHERAGDERVKGDSGWIIELVFRVILPSSLPLR